MKEKPALSINITEKTFCLCMLAAQQLLDTINSKKSFRAIVERSPEAKKITIKIYPKDIPVETEARQMLTEEQMGRIAATKQAINDLFIAKDLTYGEVKRVLWQLINEFKRKEEKYLNGSSIQVLEKSI